jgi:hypothetical protein
MLDHIGDDDQNTEAYTIAMDSIMDAQASVIDQINKDAAYLLSSITLIRRDLNLNCLLPSILNSSVALNDIRQATIDGSSIFRDKEISLTDNIIEYMMNSRT